MKTPYQSVEEMDRLYVYLLNSDNVPVCFWKGLVKDFTDTDCDHEWHSLVNDQCYGIV